MKENFLSSLFYSHFLFFFLSLSFSSYPSINPSFISNPMHPQSHLLSPPLPLKFSYPLSSTQPLYSPHPWWTPTILSPPLPWTPHYTLTSSPLNPHYTLTSSPCPHTLPTSSKGWHILTHILYILCWEPRLRSPQYHTVTWKCVCERECFGWWLISIKRSK